MNHRSELCDNERDDGFVEMQIAIDIIDDIELELKWVCDDLGNIEGIAEIDSIKEELNNIIKKLH